MSTKISRRNLFRLKPSDLLHLFCEKQSPGGQDEQPSYFRPPGALKDEKEFLSVCARCHHCSQACPFNVIEHLGPVGGEAEGTPVLKPAEDPCRWCASMDCVHACPSGALSFGAGSRPNAIGAAEINLEDCLTTQGILCDTCSLYCPPDIQAIRMEDRKPVLDRDLCTGCGLCAFHCEAQPIAIRIVKRDQTGS